LLRHDPLADARNHTFPAFPDTWFGINAAVLSLALVHHPINANRFHMPKLLVPFNFDQLGEPREYRPPAERVIEGDVVCRNWDIDSAKDGKVRAGVFESTVGVNHSIKGDTWEFCLILSGVVEITEQGQPPLTYKAGDCFIMKPGYVGTWRTIETVRKVWVTA
jgi:uncharacterized cupin superfamily protein